MNQKIQMQDTVKQRHTIQGIEKETDRFLKGMNKVPAKDKKAGNPSVDNPEKQKLIEQYIIQKNKISMERRKSKLSGAEGSRAEVISGKVLDKISAGMDTLDKAARELPVIQESDAEKLAVTAADMSVNIGKAPAWLRGKVHDHHLKKEVIQKEMVRGFEISENLIQMGDKGQEAKNHIYKAHRKAAAAMERKAEKQNLSESMKLDKDLTKIDKKYDKKITHADSPQKAKELSRKKSLEELNADEKHTKRLSKKTNKAAYKQIKKHGGLEHAAMAAAASNVATDNRIDKKTYKRENAQRIKGISNGSLERTRNLEKALKVRSQNIGNNNRHIGITREPTRKGERSVKIFKRKSTEQAAEKFLKKQEKITGKKIRKLEERKKGRTRKIENKAAIQKAKMKFMIHTLLSEDKNSDKVAGIELMKQIFTVKGTSLLKRAAGKAGHMMLALILGIVQFVISVFLSLISLFITCLFPVLLVGVCVLTIYSAIAYIGGFFNIGEGGVLTVADKEINLMDQANDLYADFSNQISSYVNQSRVTKNTEKEYVKETYTVTYPYLSSPAKGDFLADYFTMIADKQEGELTDGEDILPYLNVNTDVEKNTLNSVFGQMHYFGAETYSETSRKELIGYEQKKVTERVLTGYNDIVETHTVPADSLIHEYGTSSGITSSIYVEIDTTDTIGNYIQIPEKSISDNRMYCYLYTTSNNKIPLGCQISLESAYKNSQNEDVIINIKAQVVGIDTSGKNLYQNYPYIKLFGRTVTNLNRSEISGARKLITYRKSSGISRFVNLRSQTGYTYETTRQIPVYETRETYVDDMEKPIYKTYTYKTYCKAVYYINASTWYDRYAGSFSEKQKDTYNACVPLYQDIIY